MKARFLAALTAWLVVTVGALVPGNWVFGVPEAAAAPRKAAVASKHHRNVRVVRSVIPSPSIADDPSTPLSAAWSIRMEGCRKASRPLHGAFVAIDPLTGRFWCPPSTQALVHGIPTLRRPPVFPQRLSSRSSHRQHCWKTPRWVLERRRATTVDRRRWMRRIWSTRRAIGRAVRFRPRLRTVPTRCSASLR